MHKISIIANAAQNYNHQMESTSVSLTTVTVPASLPQPERVLLLNAFSLVVVPLDIHDCIYTLTGHRPKA